MGDKISNDEVSRGKWGAVTVVGDLFKHIFKILQAVIYEEPKIRHLRHQITSLRLKDLFLPLVKRKTATSNQNKHKLKRLYFGLTAF